MFLPCLPFKRRLKRKKKMTDETTEKRKLQDRRLLSNRINNHIKCKWTSLVLFSLNYVGFYLVSEARVLVMETFVSVTY